MPLMVNVQLFVLLPPLEHAPDQIASRPLETVNVMAVPVANDADPLLPTAARIPAGLELMLSPPRPVAETVSVAPCAGAGVVVGFSVSTADLVTPPPLTEMVTAVWVETGVVEMLKPPVVLFAGIITDPGTVTAGLLLVIWKIWSVVAGEATVTLAKDPLEPVAEVGLSVMDAGWPCGVSVTVSCTLMPFQVAVIVAVLLVATVCVVSGMETLASPAATVTTAGTITSGVSLDKVTEAPPAGATPSRPMIASGWAPPLIMPGVIISALSAGGSTLS